MRSSVFISVLSGALTVSAAACGGKYVEYTELFDTITLEEAREAAKDDPGYKAMMASNITQYPTQEYPTVNGTIQDRAVGCSNPMVRVEWRSMRDTDKRNFVNSVRCLMNAPPSGVTPAAHNRYEDLVWVHQQMTSTIHMAGSFLPWHRYYTHVFMRLIREECGYSGPFPWWDETRDAGNFANSGLFTNEYFGALPPVTSDGRGTCINNGAFAGVTLHIGPGSSNTARCLARGENTQATAQVSRSFVDTCNSRTTYADMRSCQEMGPHAYGHNGIGPVMAEVAASPSDPIFFMHHAFVDRNWKIWQNQQSWRWTSISGCAAPGDPCPPLTMDTVLSSRGIRPDVRVRDILDTENAWLCYKYDY